MKTLNLFTPAKNNEATLRNFQNEGLTIEELLKIRGGNSDDDDEDNGSTEKQTEDGFN